MRYVKVQLRTLLSVQDNALVPRVGVSNLIVYIWPLIAQVGNEKLAGIDFIEYSIRNRAFMLDLISGDRANSKVIKDFLDTIPDVF